MKNSHLNINPAIKADGRVDYILRDTETGESLLRGEWKDVSQARSEILRQECMQEAKAAT